MTNELPVNVCNRLIDRRIALPLAREKPAWDALQHVQELRKEIRLEEQQASAKGRKARMKLEKEYRELTGLEYREVRETAEDEFEGMGAAGDILRFIW